jgi:hypothetical protein
MLRAIVITPNTKTKEIGDILAIARSQARKRERSQQNPPIRSLRFLPELNVYVAVYETPETQNKPKQRRSNMAERIAAFHIHQKFLKDA